MIAMEKHVQRPHTAMRRDRKTRSRARGRGRLATNALRGGIRMAQARRRARAARKESSTAAAAKQASMRALQLGARKVIGATTIGAFCMGTVAERPAARTEQVQLYINRRKYHAPQAGTARAPASVTRRSARNAAQENGNSPRIVHMTGRTSPPTDSARNAQKGCGRLPLARGRNALRSVRAGNGAQGPACPLRSIVSANAAPGNGATLKVRSCPHRTGSRPSLFLLT